MKKRIAIISGGQSGEHEVSLVSARSIVQELPRALYEPFPIVVTKRGEWYAGKTAELLLSGQRTTLAPRDHFVLSHEPSIRGGYTGTRRTFVPIDVVFPVIHGPTGEDGVLQGLLELSGIPFVGSGVEGSALNIDKVVEKQLFLDAEFPIVNFLVLRDHHWKKNPGKSEKLIAQHLHFPLFIKPARLGSSVGIAKAHNRAELVLGIKDAFRYDVKVIVEEAMPNSRDIEVAVFGNEHPYVSPPGEIISSNEFYDYNAKYVDGKSESVIPAKIPAKQRRAIQEIAREAYILTECRGLARIDFLVNKNGICINEVNTMPGFTSISMFAKLCAYAGLPYGKLLHTLIRFAITEAKARQRKYTSFQPKTEWHKA